MGVGVTIMLVAAGISFYMGFKFAGIALILLLVKKLFVKK